MITLAFVFKFHVAVQFWAGLELAGRISGGCAILGWPGPGRGEFHVDEVHVTGLARGYSGAIPGEDLKVKKQCFVLTFRFSTGIAPE